MVRLIFKVKNHAVSKLGLSQQGLLLTGCNGLHACHGALLTVTWLAHRIGDRIRQRAHNSTCASLISDASWLDGRLAFLHVVSGCFIYLSLVNESLIKSIALVDCFPEVFFSDLHCSL